MVDTQGHAPDEVKFLLKEHRFGVVYFSEHIDSKVVMQYCLPVPALFHVLYDTVCAWGYGGHFPAFQKEQFFKVSLSTTDEDPEQQEIISLGKIETSQSYPSLKFE